AGSDPGAEGSAPDGSAAAVAPLAPPVWPGECNQPRRYASETATNSMESFFSDFARSVQFADIADILLVAIFFFVGITWLRRSSSESAARQIMALGVLIAVVYLLADLVHLFLVRQILQLLSLGFLIAAVVVFQSDIRRLLDRIGSWGE